MTSTEADYRRLSLWHDTVPGSLAARPALPGDRDADVAIVGAGYTGLWTAYYLATPRPVVADRRARSARSPGSARRAATAAGARRSSRRARATVAPAPAATRPRPAAGRMFDDRRRGRRASRPPRGSTADFAKGGTLSLATDRATLERAAGAISPTAAAASATEDDRGCSSRPRSSTCGPGHRPCSAPCTRPHCAAIHPARLVRGLAEAVERARRHHLRADPVTAIEPAHGRAPTAATVTRRASSCARPRATPPASPASARGRSRLLADDRHRAAAGRRSGTRSGSRPGRRSATTRHLIIYGQRTADGPHRVRWSRRAVPLRFAGRARRSIATQRVFAALAARSLGELFPALADAAITHTWGGPLGVPRDWYCSVGFDRAPGSAWAGGYVGDGVATTNLAGRTLADLILRRDTDLARLPWVDHRRRSGSRSRCAGSASTRGCGSSPSRMPRSVVSTGPAAPGRCSGGCSPASPADRGPIPATREGRRCVSVGG